MSNKGLIVICLTSLFFANLSFGQVNGETYKIDQMENYELSKENSHPKAQEILSSDFYWSPIEETAPFGNDAGADAFYGFRNWRLTNRQSSPVIYLKSLIKNWDLPYFDWNELDTSKIRKYISTKAPMDNSELNQQLLEYSKKMAKDAGKEFDEVQFKQILEMTSSNMGRTFLLEQDNAIIAVCFGQLVLEGKVDEDIKALGKTAINRQLLPILIDKWDGNYKGLRIEQLNSMLTVLDKIK